jgi:hypothetical protein
VIKTLKERKKLGIPKNIAYLCHVIHKPNLKSMLKLLIKLWADQKRRNFKWGRFLGQAYFFVLFMIVSVTITFATRDNVGAEGAAEIAIPFIAASIIIPDFLHKLLMKHDETVMDHYLKSKPIPERSWNRFLLITNLVNFWNWAIPVLLLPFCLIFLKWTVILPSFLLLLTVSMVGGVAITAFRRAKGWVNKWPVLVAIVVWAIVAFMYSFLAILLPWGIHVAGFFLLCFGAIALLYDYLCDLHRYDESQARASRLFLTGSSSLFSMEYIGVLRSKRLRVGVLILPLVFVFNSYTQLPQGLGPMFYMMLMFAIFAPSMMLGQWVFGVEGNYFDGLWTKPVDIRTILKNKYWFFALLNILPTLFVLPIIWVGGASPWLFPVTWLFTAGLANLSLMPTALISSRIEMFQSAFFNYQGASMAVNMYGFVVIIPMAIYVACLWLLPLTTAMIVLAVAGIVGFALHQVVINWIARKYELNRYKNFERYRS